MKWKINYDDITDLEACRCNSTDSLELSEWPSTGTYKWRCVRLYSVLFLTQDTEEQQHKLECGAENTSLSTDQTPNCACGHRRCAVCTNLKDDVDSSGRTGESLGLMSHAYQALPLVAVWYCVGATFCVYRSGEY